MVSTFTPPHTLTSGAPSSCTFQTIKEHQSAVEGWCSGLRGCPRHRAAVARQDGVLSVTILAQSFQGIPSNANSILQKMNRLQNEGDIDGAIQHMRGVVSDYPTWSMAHYNLAYLLKLSDDVPNVIVTETHSVGDYAGSATHNELAIQHQSNFPPAYVNLGSSFHLLFILMTRHLL